MNLQFSYKTHTIGPQQSIINNGIKNRGLKSENISKLKVFITLKKSVFCINRSHHILYILKIDIELIRKPFHKKTLCAYIHNRFPRLQLQC